MTDTDGTRAGASIEFPLAGAGGEPVDLWRTLTSHGFVELPPMRLDEGARTLEITVPIDGARPRTILVGSGSPGFGLATVLGPRLGQRAERRLLATLRHVLRLDEDLSGFYELAREDPDLAWVASGAARMVQSPTVFEDVVKTICTTNCAWSATERMVAALVEHLGEPAPGAPPEGTVGRAFPTPSAMAGARERFYRDDVRAGYRGPYLMALSRSVAEGQINLEELRRRDVADEQVAAQLLALPGVGPYAAAHIMLTIGRYSRLIFDSWTRPKYARLVGRKRVADSTMERRFRKYGRYAGLAFWMFLTRDWVSD